MKYSIAQYSSQIMQDIPLSCDTIEHVVLFLDICDVVSLRLAAKLFLGCREAKVTRRQRISRILSSFFDDRHRHGPWVQTEKYNSSNCDKVSYSVAIPVDDTFIKICCVISSQKDVMHSICRTDPDPQKVQWVKVCSEHFPGTWKDVFFHSELPL